MGTKNPKTGTLCPQPALLKIIMVGSGGVGKSALTLQFMYDEDTRERLLNHISRDLFNEMKEINLGQIKLVTMV
ncbi:ras-related protein Ral-a-like protein [Leptotrombidium deliense]|uniref:Ras-related protein Ral-a-like protein n=1 Tax=Leptotrombidium deliense TaxID=299467 RepID=A0A443S4E4_9ACAR|nr:ras-related protein Ral-a-like protein [Leptotrombidium deliense]